MEVLILLIGYLICSIITAIGWVLLAPKFNVEDPFDDDTVLPEVVGIIWPLVWFILIIAIPMYGLHILTKRIYEYEKSRRNTNNHRTVTITK